jgi:hypothetical protein
MSANSITSATAILKRISWQKSSFGMAFGATLMWLDFLGNRRIMSGVGSRLFLEVFMAAQCPNQAQNAAKCTCSYDGCAKHAVCCECLHYHLASKQLPGCCFPADAEKTYDRSFRKFIEVWSERL